MIKLLNDMRSTLDVSREQIQQMKRTRPTLLFRGYVDEPWEKLSLRERLKMVDFALKIRAALSTSLYLPRRAQLNHRQHHKCLLLPQNKTKLGVDLPGHLDSCMIANRQLYLELGLHMLPW